MKQANICGKRFKAINGDWNRMYQWVMRALKHLEYDVQVSPTLTFEGKKPWKSGITDNPEAVYVYNHTYTDCILEDGFYTGSKSLFLKPTAPAPGWFTIDPVGYACNVSITYEKPDFEGYDSRKFFEGFCQEVIDNRITKWAEREDLQITDDPKVEIPDQHVLVVGQMRGDSTVTEFSFGDHWRKLTLIVRKLINCSDHPIVVKLHPTMKQREPQWQNFQEEIDKWKSQGVIVLEDYESIHAILPKTRVAICENSTTGIECLMHHVPVISYGYPEYHWVTFDVRHLTQLRQAVNDLSWYSRELSDSFVGWYCEQYLCHDYESTLKRLKEILQ